MSPFNVYSFSPYIAKKRSLQNYISNHKPIHKFVYNIVQKIPYFYRELLNCTCVRRFGAKVFILCICYLSTFGIRQSFRDGPLQNLWGQGGGYSSKGNKTEKKFKRLDPNPTPPPPRPPILMLRMRWDSDTSRILPLYHWRRIIFCNTLPKRAPENEQK